MPTKTVLISGIGVAGPTLAYWLAESGFAPTLIERSPSLRTGGHVIDFWGLGYDVAERMGMLATLESEGYRVAELRFVDGRGRHVGVGARTAAASRNASILNALQLLMVVLSRNRG